jgi:hypothetical protein
MPFDPEKRVAALTVATVLLSACETIPSTTSAGMNSAQRPEHSLVVDVRSELARSSLVERSGANPIVLLGDERFDRRPIDVLEAELLTIAPKLTPVKIRKLDVRYVQGGNVDSLTYGVTLGVSGAGAILGTMLYGAMAGHARAKSPSTLEIVIDGTVMDRDFSVKHSEALTASNESQDLQRVVEVAAKLAVTKIREVSRQNN